MRILTGCEITHALGSAVKPCRRKPAVLVFTGFLATNATVSILCLHHARAVKELHDRAARRAARARKQKGK